MQLSLGAWHALHLHLHGTSWSHFCIRVLIPPRAHHTPMMGTVQKASRPAIPVPAEQSFLLPCTRSKHVTTAGALQRQVKSLFFGFPKQGLTMRLWLSWNSLCWQGWPRTPLPPSASQVLGLKVCAIGPPLCSIFRFYLLHYKEGLM